MRAQSKASLYSGKINENIRYILLLFYYRDHIFMNKNFSNWIMDYVKRDRHSN